jgi:hypothetical protein
MISKRMHKCTHQAYFGVVLGIPSVQRYCFEIQFTIKVDRGNNISMSGEDSIMG